MKYLKKILIFVLCLFPQVIFAADAPNLFGDVSFAIPNQDLSIYLLRQIFGNVGAGVESGVGTILGQLFGIFNAGLVSVSGLFLIYTISKSVMTGAMEGEVMGRQSGAHWIPFRVAMGIGLLVPKATGYSVLNVMVMWVVVQGVGFADAAWRQSLNYLNMGGALYVQPKAEQKNKPEYIDVALLTGKNADASVGDPVGSTHVLKSVICMRFLQNTVGQEATLVSNQITANPQNYPASGSIAYNKLQNLLRVPDFVPSFTDNDGLASFPGGLAAPYDRFNGVCGIYRWKWSSDVSGDNNIYMPAKNTAFQQVYYDLDAPVANLVSALFGLPTGTSPADYDTFLKKYEQPMGMQLLDSVSDYQSILYPVRLLAKKGYKNQSDQDPKLAFLAQNSDAMKQGWITAGKYYYDIMTINVAASDQIDSNHYQVLADKVSPPNFSPMIPMGGQNTSFAALSSVGKDLFAPYIERESDSSFKPWTQAWGDNADLFKKLMQWTSVPEAQAKVLAAAIKENIDTGQDLSKIKFDAVAAGVTNAQVNMHGSGFLQTSDWVVYTPLNTSINNIIKVWVEQMVGNNENSAPIVKLQILGNAIIYQCLDFWDAVMKNLEEIAIGYTISITVLTGFATALAGFSLFGAGVGAQIGIMGVIDTLNHIFRLLFELPITIALPMATAVIGPLFVVGIILAYYTPLIPFMLFTFGTISWMIFVIEAMAAAPIVALGITHPEGHDLLGKSEQAVMLLLSVFVRPISMIIGLIVSIILSYIVLEVLNIGYGHIVSAVFFSSEPVMTGKYVKVNDMIRSVAVIMLYPFIVLPIINQCFSLIYVIPEKIMRWIGMHPDAGQEAQMLENVKGQVQQQAEAGSRGAGASLERGGSATGGGGVRHPSFPKAKGNGNGANTAPAAGGPAAE